MAVKLADTLAPMGDFEIAEAKDISVNIGGTKKMLQKAIEDGDIGGSSDIVVKCTEDQYGALLPEQKALNIIYCTEKNLYYHDETIVPVVDTTPITDSIGSLDSLKTTEKTNLVGAINEVSDSLVDKADKNEVNEKLSEFIKTVNVILPNSGTLAMYQQKDYVNYDVSDSIPNGYKLLSVIGSASGDKNFIIYACRVTGETMIDFRITNMGSASNSGTPQVVLICVKQ